MIFFNLGPNVMHVTSEGSAETAPMRRHVWALDARIFDRYQNLVNKLGPYISSKVVHSPQSALDKGLNAPKVSFIKENQQ